MASVASFAFTSTKWALNMASRLIKADVRVHNAEVVQPDMAIIFAVNHFTRLETILLPYMFHQQFGKEVWSLAAGELFTGRIGRFLRQMGTVSTKDPDRDKVIINSLLTGENPWVIFPEGSMIKDKKVVDPAGQYTVYHDGDRRPPHKGVAALALRTEFYRHKIECIYNSPKQEGLERIKEMFGVENPESVLGKRTVIIPVNVTYYPIRSRENLVLRMAGALAKDLSPRVLDELSVEGTFVSADTDIDITLGEPICMQSYLQSPRYGELLACGDDLSRLEEDPRSLFTEAAIDLMPRYMDAIYQMTRVNYDHIFATLVRYQGSRPFTERRYRNRIFLCAHRIAQQGRYTMHQLLKTTYRDIIYEDSSEKFKEFVAMCLKEGVLTFDGKHYRRVLDAPRGMSDFHSVRGMETTWVIANELEPLTDAVDIIKDVSKATRHELSEEIRALFLEEDRRIFDEDYEKFVTEESHPPDIGQPFLLVPERYRAGVVLVHGYMAAPEEVRRLAEFLYERGYVVYGVRLKGHGTAPEDLADVQWEEWYESLNRGYTIVKTYTDRIILGGFSTGGCMALIGAARKREKIDAVFSICAPRRLRQFAARLVPSVVGFNNLIKRIRGGDTGWEYVVNEPENAHINYRRNPLSGVRELSRAMDAMEVHLPRIVSPTVVLQGSKDPVVDPASAMEIFEKVGTPLKEMTMFERENHGIVNGARANEIFERVYRFLLWSHQQEPEARLITDEEIEMKPEPSEIDAPPAEAMN